MNNLNHIKGSLIGLAIGDALGTTIEFSPRDTNPELTDIIGGGCFKLNPGEWTDDTSMALCLANSLIENGFDPEDQLKKYYDWYTTGYMSSTGICFDIGTTTKNALISYKRTNKIYNNDHFLDAGNGSLMRLAPVSIYYNSVEGSTEFFDLLKYSGTSSKTTHSHNVPVHACIGFSVMLNRAFNNNSKHEIMDFSTELLNQYNITSSEIQNILLGSYKTKSRNEILSTGYVVHTLEAALWAFYNTTNFKDAVLLAANLGEDSDTVAAVCGQIAGAYYGLDGIPIEWIDIIKFKNEILDTAEELYNKGHSNEN